jgi:hypothetical protein
VLVEELDRPGGYAHCKSSYVRSCAHVCEADAPCTVPA